MKTTCLGMFLCVVALNAQAPDGEAIYKKQCAMCHDNGAASRAPDRAALSQRTADSAMTSLTAGTMVAQGATLSDAEKRAVVEFVTGKKLGTAASGAALEGLCANPKAPMPDPAKMPMWNGWGSGIEQNHFADAKTAGLTAAQVPNLKLKWAFGMPGGTMAFAQPAVVAGRVFIGTDKGRFYSLDAATGCTYWMYNAGAGVRSAAYVTAIKSGPAKYGVFFGDLTGNVYGLNAQTGELLWKVKVDKHAYARITGGIVGYGDRIYAPVSSVEEVPGAQATYPCCTFRGAVVAMDTASGNILWKNYTIPDEPKPTKMNAKGVQLFAPAGAAVWAAPTLDLKAKAVYVGSGNAYTEPAVPTSDSVIAYDMETGKMLWASQAMPKDAFVIGCRAGNENCPVEVGPDFDFGTSPMLRNLPGGKRILVVGQKSGVLWGLDPDDKGKILWQYRAGKGGALGGIEWGAAVDETQAYAPISDRLLPEAGGLHAVKIATGERVWYTPPAKLNCTPTGGMARGNGCNAAQSAAIAAMPGVVFSGSVDGHMRAYSTKDGSVIWDYDAMHDFETVNKVPGSGGSFDSGGPSIVGGMLFTASGYGQWGGRPGNVLLAFAPQ
jgi:polyvinyl alcohol dehydrogenase (cytochrome)